MANFYWDIGVDLGTNNTLIYLKERGIIIDEPTMVARFKRKRWLGAVSVGSRQAGVSRPRGMRVVAYGLRAKEMWNREPGQIEVVQPVKNGVISDLEVTESLVGYYLKLSSEVPSKFPKLLKPRVLAGVSSNITNVQRRALRSVFLTAGVSEVTLVENSILAAVGVGVPFDRTSAAMVVDVGGGKTEASVVSMGGIVVGRWLRTAGNDLDEAVVNYIKIKYGILIGRKSAERLKIELCGMGADRMEEGLLRGRDLETGLPKSIRVGRSEVMEAVVLSLARIAKLVVEVLDETPAELMEEIIKKGIILVGGGANVLGLDKMIEKETKITTVVAEEPKLAVARGVGELIEKPELLEKIKIVGIG